MMNCTIEPASDKIIDRSDQIATHLTGYLHPSYAASLAEFGNPRELSACGGWILERRIPDWPYLDAMGCYPLFCCKDWEGLSLDLSQLENQITSLALVTDPFGDFQVDELKQNFDTCFHYKDHYLTDLNQSIEATVSQGHRKKARQALRHVKVETCLEPLAYLDEWLQLYGCIIDRHHVQGIRRFSKNAFEIQLNIPGAVYFRVLHEGRLVGGILFYLQNDVVYSHLSASTDEGYSLGASYAARWAALEYFAGKISWMSHGAGAGIRSTGDDGLSNFKLGWSTGTRPVYFCGRILDRQKYAELARAASARAAGQPESTYFPVYRAGEYA